MELQEDAPPLPPPLPPRPPATTAMDAELPGAGFATKLESCVSPRPEADAALDTITPAFSRLMSHSKPKRELEGGEGVRSALSVRWEENGDDDGEEFVVARECKRRDEFKA